MGRRLRVVIIAIVLHLTVLSGAGAREANCRSALDQCIAQCERNNVMFAAACLPGCYLSYLGCD